MSAETKQTYAYWIRNEATDSQLEAIRSQHDELVRELARLRTERDALRAALWETTTRYHALQKHDGVFDDCQYATCKRNAALLSADTAGQEREG